MYQVGALPTKVVCLTQVVTADELKDDEEYEDIMEDMRLEAGKYGKFRQLLACYSSSLKHTFSFLICCWTLKVSFCYAYVFISLPCRAPCHSALIYTSAFLLADSVTHS